MARIKFKHKTTEILEKLYVKKEIFQKKQKYLNMLLISLSISGVLNIILVTLLILLKK